MQGGKIAKCPGVRIIIMQHIVQDAVYPVNPGTNLHALLRKMSKLVCNDCLEFTHIHGVYKPQPDLQVFFDGEEHAPEGGIIKNCSIHIRTQIDPFGM